MLNHYRYTKNGRLERDISNKNHYRLKQKVLEENILTPIGYAPYIWDGTKATYKDAAIEFANDRQILHTNGKISVTSSQLFIERNVNNDIWVNVPHGMPNRRIEWADHKLKSILAFPDSINPFNMSFNIGGSKWGLFTYTFTPNITGKYRFIWVNDGISGEPELISSYRDESKTGLTGDKITGVKFPDITFKWNYFDSEFKTLNINQNENLTYRCEIITTVDLIADVPFEGT